MPIDLHAPSRHETTAHALDAATNQRLRLADDRQGADRANVSRSRRQD